HGEAHHEHFIRIAEFRTPAFSVSLNDDVTHSGALPLIVGESIEMSAEANYYAGGALAGAAIEWEAKLETASYEPPGWEEFWFHPETENPAYGELFEVDAKRKAALAGNGSASLALEIAALPAPRPSVLNVRAFVTDVDRMQIEAQARAIVVHPSSY